MRWNIQLITVFSRIPYDKIPRNAARENRYHHLNSYTLRKIWKKSSVFFIHTVLKFRCRDPAKKININFMLPLLTKRSFDYITFWQCMWWRDIVCVSESYSRKWEEIFVWKIRRSSWNYCFPCSVWWPVPQGTVAVYTIVA